MCSKPPRYCTNLDLVKAKRVDAACALISEPANVKSGAMKSKKTHFDFVFDKVLGVKVTTS